MEETLARPALRVLSFLIKDDPNDRKGRQDPDATSRLTPGSLRWIIGIPLTTIGLRLCLLPFAIQARLALRRQNGVRHIQQATQRVLESRIRQSPLAQKKEISMGQASLIATKERRKRMGKLFKDLKAQSWKIYIQPMVQIPVWTSMSIGLRTLARSQDYTGSFLDFVRRRSSSSSDNSLIGPETGRSATESAQQLVAEYFPNLDLGMLSQPDPTLILPIVIGACSLANAQLTSQAIQHDVSQRQSRISRYTTEFARGASIILMALAFNAPAAIALYWASSASFGLVQTILMNKFLPIHDDNSSSSANLATARDRYFAADTGAKRHVHVGLIPQSWPRDDSSQPPRRL